MSDDRRLAVLRAIVEDYVAHPGAGRLARRWSSGTSSASPRRRSATTWRRWRTRATSPSRTPAPAGSPPTRATGSSSTGSPAVKPLTAAERRAIQNFLDGAVDLDDVVGRTVRLLAQLTRQVAVVQYPSLTPVDRAPRRAARADARPGCMLVLITDTGRVEQRVVDCPAPVGDDARWPICARGSTAASPGAGSPTSPQLVARPARGLRARATGRRSRPCVATLLETLVEETRGAGGARRHRQPHPVRARLPRQRAARCSRRSRSRSCCCGCSARRRRSEQVTVRIGHENTLEGLAGDLGRQRRLRRRRGRSWRELGVVGPTRMDYPGTMGAVRAVARYVGRILAES